jgi:hypothetical protein
MRTVLHCGESRALRDKWYKTLGIMNMSKLSKKHFLVLISVFVFFSVLGSTSNAATVFAHVGVNCATQVDGNGCQDEEEYHPILRL